MCKPCARVLLWLGLSFGNSYSSVTVDDHKASEWMTFEALRVSTRQALDECVSELHDGDDLGLSLHSVAEGCQLVLSANPQRLHISSPVDLSGYRLISMVKNDDTELILQISAYSKQIIFIKSAYQSNIRIRFDFEYSNFTGYVYGYRDQNRQIFMAGEGNELSQDVVLHNPALGGAGDDPWYNRLWRWLKRSFSGKFRPAYIPNDLIDETDFMGIYGLGDYEFDDTFALEERSTSSFSLGSEKTVLCELNREEQSTEYYQRSQRRDCRYAREAENLRRIHVRERMQRQRRAAVCRALLTFGRRSSAGSECTVISPLHFNTQVSDVSFDSGISVSEGTVSDSSGVENEYEDSDTLSVLSLDSVSLNDVGDLSLTTPPESESSSPGAQESDGYMTNSPVFPQTENLPDSIVHQDDSGYISNLNVQPVIDHVDSEVFDGLSFSDMSVNDAESDDQLSLFSEDDMLQAELPTAAPVSTQLSTEDGYLPNDIVPVEVGFSGRKKKIK